MNLRSQKQWKCYRGSSSNAKGSSQKTVALHHFSQHALTLRRFLHSSFGFRAWFALWLTLCIVLLQFDPNNCTFWMFVKLWLFIPQGTFQCPSPDCVVGDGGNLSHAVLFHVLFPSYKVLMFISKAWNEITFWIALCNFDTTSDCDLTI